MAITDPAGPTPPNPSQRPALAALLPYTTVLVILAACYAGWTFYSRHTANQEAEQALQSQKQEHEKKVADQIFGNGEVSFKTFGADKAIVKRGETAQLCYGVVNAKNVKLDPPVEQGKPTYHHCLEIAPKQTTTYTITADDGAGHSKSESITVKVE